MENIRQIIEVESMAGSNVKDCIRDMRSLSRRDGAIVKTDFNGIILTVHELSSIASVVDYYNKILYENSIKQRYEQVNK